MKSSKSFKLLALILLSMGSMSASYAATYYVNSNAAGGNGSSWAKAFNNLDAALSAAKLHPGPDQIWVAKGVYKPNIKYGGNYAGNESNLVTFKLPDDVALFGGFIGNEQYIFQRNIIANKTILSGDINGDDVNNPQDIQYNKCDPMNNEYSKCDNAWHVLTADGVNGVLLDGFTVVGGYANGPDMGATSGAPQNTLVSIEYLHSGGGGLLAIHGAKVTINNSKFEYNGASAEHSTIRGNPLLGNPTVAAGGAAIAAVDEGTQVNVNVSSFENNNAFGFGSNGGALSAKLEASFNVSLCAFKNNTADRNGGGIHAKDAELIKVVASKFEDNKITGSIIGDESGGGIGVINANLTVSLSSFTDNAGGSIAGGGGIFFHVPFDDGEIYVMNVTHSNFKNNTAGFVGGGAINIFGLKPKVGTNVAISNCLFDSNLAINGGALYVDSIPTTLSNSVFYNNKANFSGGAIFASNFGDAIFAAGPPVSLNDRSELKISNSVFKQNDIIGESPQAPPSVVIFNIFANGLSTVFGQPLSSVTAMSSGGGAVAAELGSNVNMQKNILIANHAPNASGGALLIGGSGGTPTMIGQNYLKISQSYCSQNSADNGNNSALIDPDNLGNNPNGVQYVTDGSCQ
ncbi:MAG: right-handed parallel beta-helix repeat-containing protein [Candidatus Berkiella sp.]